MAISDRGCRTDGSRNVDPFVRRIYRLAAGACLISCPVAFVHAQDTGGARGAALTRSTAVESTFFKALRYRMIGPARGGRVTTVTGIASEPHTFYMGSTGGGVWKTTDAGITWRNVSDEFFAAGSMGAIDVADSDPNVIYAGTGSDGLRSNVSTGVGVYKSTDGAKTWRLVGLRESGHIGAVAVHPSNPDVAFAAAIGNAFKPNAERGVFRTLDGGASWQKVLHVSDSTGAVDVELQPSNPNVVFASMWRAERKPWTIISGAREGGVYKSTDAGTTWRKLGRGLPSELFGKSNVAVTPANPNRVYALVEAAPGGGLYRSDDAGESWSQVSSLPGLITRPFYYINITADPKNADVVYVGTEGFYKSMDGGRTFRTMPTPHGDNHDLWINPNNSDIWVQSNDGGANVTLDGGRTWSTQYNQPTAEIYQVAVDNQVPYRVYGAQQDNSTLIVPSLPLTASPPDDPMQQWRAGPGCETGPIIPHPANPDTVYGSCKGQYSRMSLRSGQEKQYWVGAQSLYGNPGKDLILRFQRVSPMEISPHDPRTLYYGSQHVHRTRDEGVTWERISPDLTWNPLERQQTPSGEPITLDVTGEEYYSTLYAIRESALEPGVIWTGANDGPFHVTRDGGKTWRNITPPDLPPGGRVQNIDPSPHRRGSAYYAVLRYLLGDFRPYLYRTDDYGKSWTLLTDGTNGIPAGEPTRVVREDPDRAGLLYAGTEFGMFISFDNGGNWQAFQLNLPHTPVTDIRVHRKDLVISTQGRSFWILDNLSPLHQLTDRVAKAVNHLFKPRDAYRFRYSIGFGGAESARSAPGDPQYPPAGAAIDYWLSTVPEGALTLEIMDSAGTVLRTFSSDAPADTMKVPPAEEPGMRAPAMERAGTPKLPKAAGSNRFTWDFSLPGPWDSNRDRSGRYGPMVLPGTYRVRLTAGDSSATQPLVVRMDPRVARDGVTLADLREQLRHNIRVRDMVTDVNRLVERLSATGADTIPKLADLRAKLVTPPVRYSKPGLQAHITYLYALTMQADQKIGRDAVARYRVLRAELDALLLGIRDWGLGNRESESGFP
ncbi:MAG: WD40/YVTN/BNR-like repeat-containing protein [Gemmatimonadaceae bacterium]